MNLLRKYFSKLFFKQFSIGILEDDIEQIIRQKKTTLSFKWLKLNHYNNSIADPFAFSNSKGELKILAEIFTTGELDGKICQLSYDDAKGFSTPEIIFGNGKHLSYPCIYKEENKMNVLLTELDGGLINYEYNERGSTLTNEKLILDLPLVDASLLKKDDKYWFFGTLLENGSSNRLYIYYADNFFGPYKSHALNPVKNNLNGSRSAGNFIHVDGSFFRPSQNCKNYYGESITINKIVKLSETEFEEEEHMTIKAKNSAEYNFGVHTINAEGKYVIVDGQKGHFQPFLQIFRAVKRYFDRNKNKLTLTLYYMNGINFEEYIAV